MEDTYETMRRDMMISEEISKIQEAYGKIEEIEDDDHTDGVERISQLNEIIKNVGKMNVHDEVYNQKDSVVEHAKDLVNRIASSL